jgi:hypothetical protein
VLDNHGIQKTTAFLKNGIGPMDEKPKVISSSHDTIIQLPPHEREMLAVLRKQPEDATSNLSSPPQFPTTPRWGRLPFGHVLTVRLTIQGQSQPVLADLQSPQVLGRRGSEGSEQPDLALDAYNAREKGVSRTHAVLVVQDNIPKVVDMNSTNGTFLNGQKLIPWQPRILRHDDELCLGSLVLRVSFDHHS